MVIVVVVGVESCSRYLTSMLGNRAGGGGSRVGAGVGIDGVAVGGRV